MIDVRKSKTELIHFTNRRVAHVFSRWQFVKLDCKSETFRCYTGHETSVEVSLEQYSSKGQITKRQMQQI